MFLAACQACQSVSKPAKLKSALKALIFGTIRAVLVLDREGTRLLTELSVQSMKPKAQRFMRADRDGLYLEVVPGGQKYWWFVSQAGGKRKKVSIGKWPDVSLRRARELLAVKKREAGIACFSPEVEGVLLSEIAEEWYRVRISGFSEGHRARVRRWLDDYVLPKFKGRALATITGPEILAVCREAEGRGHFETAHRVLNVFSQVFKYAMPFYVQGDPTAILAGKLAPVRTKHFARVTDAREVSVLMRSIRGYPRPRVRNALLFSAYTFCRPGEVRMAEWGEFDLERAVWRIPAEKMKMRRPHIVPLAKQVVELLKDQRGRIDAAGLAGRFVFPSERGASRPMSADTVRIAIRSMGFGADAMTAHGFRGMASTLLNESGLWSPDAIELQLAHAEGNSVRAAYNEATMLPERTRMMQWWADELDGLGDMV